MGRVIKRYGNRKLYDTRESRYITLDEIAGYVREGEEVSVIENQTGTDLTVVAFAQIILEEERRRGDGFLSLAFLRQLIRNGEQLPEGLVGKVAPMVDAMGGMTGRGAQEIVGMGEHLGNGASELKSAE